MIATIFRNKDGRFDVCFHDATAIPQEPKRAFGLGRQDMILQFHGEDQNLAAEFAASNEDQCVIGQWLSV